MNACRVQAAEGSVSQALLDPMAFKIIYHQRKPRLKVAEPWVVKPLDTSPWWLCPTRVFTCISLFVTQVCRLGRSDSGIITVGRLNLRFAFVTLMAALESSWPKLPFLPSFTFLS